MDATWRKTTSFLAFLFLLFAPSALAGPGGFGVAGYPVCLPTHAAGVHLSWSSSSGASSYKVFRSGQAISGVLPASTLAFDDSTSGSTYSVVATDSHGFTFTSNNVTPPSPNSSFCLGGDLQVGEAAYCAVNGPAVHLAWTAGSSSSYIITDANGNLVAIVDGSTSSYDVKGLSGGNAVRYSVNNTDANNGQFVTTPSCPAFPGSFTLSATTACANNVVSVQLSWTAASGATQYRVYRDGVVISTTTARSFTDTPVTAGHAYSYTISALNGSGSTESNTLPVTAATCTPPPGAFAASASAFCTTGASPMPGVHVTWTASSNAASYVVNRNGTAYSSSLASTMLAYDDLNVTVGQTYTYTVTATDSGGSTLSSGQAVTLSSSTCPTIQPPTAPVLTGSTICKGTSPSTHLSWTVSTNATNYMVFRNGAALSALLPSSTMTYDDDSVAAGQGYSYFVRASNGGGTADSNTINLSVLLTACQPPPQSFTLSATAFCNTSSSPAAAVSLTWTASTNATSYLIFRDDTQIGSVATMAFADNANVVAGQSYAYFVRASGPGGTADSNNAVVNVDPKICDAAAPDLVVTSAGLSASTVLPGDSVVATIGIANNGTAAAGATTTRLRFGKGPDASAGDRLLWSVATPAFVQGAATTLTQPITIPDVAGGTYYIFVTLDDDHILNESNTTNNVARTVALQVQSVACTLSCGTLVPHAATVGSSVLFSLVQPLTCFGPAITWTFGDGGTSSYERPAHVYATAGTYPWSLTISANGQSCQSSGTIVITVPPIPTRWRAAKH